MIKKVLYWLLFIAIGIATLLSLICEVIMEKLDL